MRQYLMSLTVSGALLCGVGTGAQALPLVATFTGYLEGTSDPFVATFHYNTRNLVTDEYDSNYLDGKPETTQWATFTSDSQTLTFYNFSEFPDGYTYSFTKGEYDSVVYDDNGDGGISEIDTVHTYSIYGPQGYLTLTFGGANDGGEYVLGADGLNSVNLDPTSYALTKDVVSPVPLPPSILMFGGALMALGVAGYRRRSLTT